MLAGPAELQQQLSVQEICSYDSNIAFWESSQAPAVTRTGVMQMILQPTVSLKSNRFSSSKHSKVRLLGACSVQLASNAYTITLPKLLLRGLTGPSTQVELAGDRSHANLCFKTQHCCIEMML